jgi:hypothetical protein
MLENSRSASGCRGKAKIKTRLHRYGKTSKRQLIMTMTTRGLSRSTGWKKCRDTSSYFESRLFYSALIWRRTEPDVVPDVLNRFGLRLQTAPIHLLLQNMTFYRIAAWCPYTGLYFGTEPLRSRYQVWVRRAGLAHLHVNRLVEACGTSTTPATVVCADIRALLKRLRPSELRAGASWY